jgi:hypothetical protein
MFNRLCTSILLFALLALGACGQRAAPDCASEATRYKVIQKTSLTGFLGEPAYDNKQLLASHGISIQYDGGKVNAAAQGAKLKSELVDVRTLSRNKEVGSWDCAATLVFEVTSDGSAFEKGTRSKKIPVTYRSELTQEGQTRTHYVSGPMTGNGKTETF